ncbi:MAG: hypothetical protein FK731_14090 [Asgard group archaeon]|nr:hypothetical protein [Asgard group archaeon]
MKQEDFQSKIALDKNEKKLGKVTRVFKTEKLDEFEKALIIEVTPAIRKYRKQVISFKENKVLKFDENFVYFKVTHDEFLGLIHHIKAQQDELAKLAKLRIQEEKIKKRKELMKRGYFHRDF